MNNNLNNTNDKQYKQGFNFGILPVFADFEDSNKCGKNFRSQAFQDGYNDGRSMYIQLNGKLKDGIPHIILTPSLMQKIFILGLIKAQLQIPNGFSIHQISVIKNQYQKGFSQHDLEWNALLKSLLNNIGIHFAS